MHAVQTGKPPESQTHVTFETAAEHATARVPVAGPFQRVGDVREHQINDSSADTIVSTTPRLASVSSAQRVLVPRMSTRATVDWTVPVWRGCWQSLQGVSGPVASARVARG
jgi:hypothetical protein